MSISLQLNFSTSPNSVRHDAAVTIVDGRPSLLLHASAHCVARRLTDRSNCGATLVEVGDVDAGRWALQCPTVRRERCLMHNNLCHRWSSWAYVFRERYAKLDRDHSVSLETPEHSEFAR
eukprot:4845112-Prymnesium_polylepis.1